MAKADAVSHTQYVLMNRLATPMGAFIILILIGRHSDALLGEYAVVMTFYYIMQMLPLLGLTSYVMREVAREPKEAGRYFNTIGFMSMVGCIVIDLIFYGFLQIVDYSPAVREATAVLGVLIFPGILVFIAEIIFMSLHQAKPVGLVALVDNGTRVVISVIVLWLDGGLAGLIWAFFFTRLGSCIAYLHIMKQSGIVERFEWPNLALLRKTWNLLPPFLIGALLFVVLSRMDFLVLSIFEQVEVIGYYAIGYRLFDISIIVLTALIMAIFPSISKKFVGARLHYLVAVKNMILLFAVGLAMLCFAGALFSEYYVSILFAKQFPHPVFLTQLFMAALLIAGLDFVASGVLHASDLQTPDTRAMAVGGVINLVLLFGLVPIFGIYGAFIGKMIATTVQGVIKFRIIEQSVGRLWQAVDFYRVAILVAMLATLALVFLNSGFFAKVGISLVVLFGVPVLLVLLGILQPLKLLRFYVNPYRMQLAAEQNSELDAEPAAETEPPKPLNALDQLCIALVGDMRHHAQWQLRRNGRVARRETIWLDNPLDKGQWAVVLYRLSWFAGALEWNKVAVVMATVNRWLTGVTISRDSHIAPGLVLLDGGRVSIHAHVSGKLVCHGSVVIGDKQQAASATTIDDNCVLPSGAVVNAN